MLRLSQLLLALAIIGVAFADVYMHNPRGSNNRLHERSANRNNGNRLFDSQNNNRGGYNVGVRGSNANQDAVQDLAKDLSLTSSDLETLYTIPSRSQGLQSGTIYPMTFFDGSYMAVEWTNQHGCGGNEANDPQVINCNMVLQYMCDTEDGLVRIKDGENTNTPPEPTSFADAKTKDASTTEATGRHESAVYYQECKTRRRNRGLFTADQNLQGDTAKFTRQNPNGNRRGYECPEERDYYPYWHPSPWIDVAILHDTLPTADFCAQIVSQSMNTATRHKCVPPANAADDSTAFTDAVKANTQAQCTTAGGIWTGFTHQKPAPACEAASWSRENHLGNSGVEQQKLGNSDVLVPPQPAQYMWKLPSWTELTTGATRAKKYTSNGDEYARCVFRLRYNMTSDDYSPSTNSSFNANPNTGKRSPIEENPTVNIGADNAALKLAINTAQVGRVFQDRSHSFTIKNRATAPGGASTGKIFNLNVRGKRGNIVQTFPAVEYDFIPTQLAVTTGDFVHVQWTGSNTHNNGNPAGDGQAGDAGEGTGGTDRQNMVAFPDQLSNYPIPNLQYGVVATKNFLNNARCWSISSNTQLTNFDCQIRLASSGYYTDKTDFETATTAMDALLNNAEPTLVSGVLLQMTATGTYHFGCTRNNNFSNRSQKGCIVVY